jgi:hypothetical protein
MKNTKIDNFDEMTKTGEETTRLLSVRLKIPVSKFEIYRDNQFKFPRYIIRINHNDHDITLDRMTLNILLSVYSFQYVAFDEENDIYIYF